MPKINAQLEALTVGPTACVRDTLEAIDRGERQIALVVDGDGRLVATVTDGDIRRALLRGAGLETPVTDVMSREFTAVHAADGSEAAVRLMQARKLHQIPVIDGEGRPVDLVHINSLGGIIDRETRVVLMAGGLGTRLRPLTETVPKPMLPVGGKPILEKILQNFTKQGFHNFTISLNYKGEMIRDHFGDGRAFGARIEYVEETKRMGTAGALSLLPERPTAPFVVMNSDLLTSVRFDSVLRFHTETNAVATMCAREYSVQIPFGVIDIDGTSLKRVIEKPTHTHLVNAGIYVLSPETLDHVEAGTWLDMPTLFERLVAAGQTASVYPIHEYWIDIGRMEDLERARTEFDENDNA